MQNCTCSNIAVRVHNFFYRVFFLLLYYFCQIFVFIKGLACLRLWLSCMCSVNEESFILCCFLPVPVSTDIKLAFEVYGLSWDPKLGQYTKLALVYMFFTFFKNWQTPLSKANYIFKKEKPLSLLLPHIFNSTVEFLFPHSPTFEVKVQGLGHGGAVVRTPGAGMTSLKGLLGHAGAWTLTFCPAIQSINPLRHHCPSGQLCHLYNWALTSKL